jgi:hypothetical protein
MMSGMNSSNEITLLKKFFYSYSIKTLILVLFFVSSLMSQEREYMPVKSATNIHQNPDSTSSVLLPLQAGAYVKVLQRDGEWIKVRVDNLVGYCKVPFEAEEMQSNSSADSQSATAGKQPVARTQKADYAVSAEDYRYRISELSPPADLTTAERAAFFSNSIKTGGKEFLQLKVSTPIYQAPDYNSPILLPLESGAYVRVLEKSGSWIKVQVDNLVGFFPSTISGTASGKASGRQNEKEDELFFMGLAMLRLNWTDVSGDSVRFRYSDLGLPADFSTRERASFTVDGTLGNGDIELDGYLNYDPDNRITEPPLDFLINLRRGDLRMSIGDYRRGVLQDSIFTHYNHPFRGAIVGYDSERFTLEFIGGLARGESTIEEIPATLGSGPYYLTEAPVLRGSEMIYLVTLSRADGQTELQRRLLLRNQDYYMDYDRGTILLTYPQLSTDELGNPVSLVVAYQFESLVGQFSRAIFGYNARIKPFDFLTLSTSYIGDADKSLPLNTMLDEHKGIVAVGANLNTERLELLGEMSWGLDPVADSQAAYFVGGKAKLFSNLNFILNSWSVESEFPAFANRQIQYGYSLIQVLPELNQRSVMLSPFQFSRNLGSELYPFTMSRLSLGSEETHGMLEWENGVDRISAGYGVSSGDDSFYDGETAYISALHNGEDTIAWGKAGRINRDNPFFEEDNQITDVLGGIRHRLKRFSNGDIFLQADVQADWQSEPGFDEDARRNSFSVLAEYLSGQDGIFVGLRRESVQPFQGSDIDLTAFETGVRHPVFRGIFVDSRYRYEQTEDEQGNRGLSFLALGLGFESDRFRALGRYETQVNDLVAGENRRETWSLFLFGSPIQRMSVSLQYYRRKGENDNFISLTRRSEEQFNARFLWRPYPNFNVYSQWRYDTNLELLPPLNEIESNSLASVQGLKWKLYDEFEFLANYKLLKIWGPINNRKYSAAVELGYLVQRHVRLGFGVERIDYRDEEAPEADYQSNVYYLKFVLFY